MCETCSPLCGNCKPALLKAILCEGCGKANLLSREECLVRLRLKHRRTAIEEGKGDEWDSTPLLCRSCGADLQESLQHAVQPLECLYSGIICGYPCGRKEHLQKGLDEACKTQVPLGRLPSSNSSGMKKACACQVCAGKDKLYDAAKGRL